jgi:hypothetical protein
MYLGGLVVKPRITYYLLGAVIALHIRLAPLMQILAVVYNFYIVGQRPLLLAPTPLGSSAVEAGVSEVDCPNGVRFFGVRRFGLELLNINSTPKFLRTYYRYRGSVLTTGF